MVLLNFSQSKNIYLPEGPRVEQNGRVNITVLMSNGWLRNFREGAHLKKKKISKKCLHQQVSQKSLKN